MKTSGKAVSAGAAWGWRLRRKPGGKTLAGELRALESQAKDVCTAAGTTYSRAALAGQSGVSKETLSAWIDGERTPHAGDSLMKVVTALTNLSRQAAPDESSWRELWAAARQDRRLDRKPAADRKKLRPLVTWVAGTVVTIEVFSATFS